MSRGPGGTGGHVGHAINLRLMSLVCMGTALLCVGLFLAYQVLPTLLAEGAHEEPWGGDGWMHRHGVMCAVGRGV